ncbi:MAG: sensor histidine kinase [Gemmatimonadales bacterium]
MGAPRRIPALLWPGLIALAMLGLALVVGTLEPPGPGGGRGPMLPRVPAPATDFRALLRAFGVGSSLWYAVLLALVPLVWVSRKLDPERLGWRRTALLAAALVVGLAALSASIRYLAVYGGAPLKPPIGAFLQAEGARHLLAWVAVGGMVALVEGARRSIGSRLEQARLRSELAEQRLLTLTAQLHPHFLFNTLQGISTLIHRDADAADEMLALLGDLLRDALRHRDRPMVTLGEELRFARTYLAIIRTRFADRFAYDVDVPDALLDQAVPLFLLQPLIENAVQHGIGERIEGGRVTIRGRERNGRVILEVLDDGAGGRERDREGIGLGNTRARLATAFGGAASLELVDGEVGSVARIEIPRRAMEPSA